VLVATFLVVRFIGENLISFIFEPFFTRWYHPFILKITAGIPLDLSEKFYLAAAPIHSSPLAS